jgi:transposase
MNHLQKRDTLRKLLTQIRSHEYPYEHRPKESRNWSDYDLAQVREMADMIKMIRDTVDEATRRLASRKESVTNMKPGRPREHHPADLVKILLLQSYMEAPNRIAEGLLLLFSEKLGITDHFSYKSIERAYDDEEVRAILDEVFKVTNEPVRDLETDFSVDGSGKSTSNKTNYAQDRQRQRNKEKSASEEGIFPRGKMGLITDYQYHVAIIGVKYKLFSGFISTSDHSIGETTMFPRVMEQAMSNHPGMKNILGDGAYARRPYCNIANKYGVTPYFLPRRDLTIRKKGSREWVKMNLSLLHDPRAWLLKYHMRSISETGFSMVGRMNRGPIRKHLVKRKATEDYLIHIIHNLKRLCYLTHVENLEVLFAS